MSLLSNSAPDERPLHRELAHVIRDILAITIVAAFLLYLTAASSTRGDIVSRTGLLELAALGTQVAKDVSFLFPTLIAVQVLLLGAPLAGVRTRGRTATATAQFAAAGSYGIAAVGISAFVLGCIAAVGHPETSARLWTILILLLIIVVMALATGTLVFGPAIEQLRQAQERRTAIRTTLELLNHRILDGADAPSTRAPLRNLLAAIVAAFLITVVTASSITTIGHGLTLKGLLPSALGSAALSGWAIIWCAFIVTIRSVGHTGWAALMSVIEVTFFGALPSGSDTLAAAAIISTAHVIPFTLAWATPRRRAATVESLRSAGQRSDAAATLPPPAGTEPNSRHCRPAQAYRPGRRIFRKSMLPTRITSVIPGDRVTRRREAKFLGQEP